ncbi:MAG TPA: potassium-transporting ATPase subunit F [Microthrixaceae bacterium]|jgi:K+-transporting ATPase KdpF subunit|nr:potassium-transporting ATPase subunit F [Microthrixaceae bacterium]HQF93844.1 potassium-transporting ATPase subunit F [Microthrixaceae bacterium]
MSGEEIAALVVAVVLLAYLIAAFVVPEKF